MLNTMFTPNNGPLYLLLCFFSSIMGHYSGPSWTNGLCKQNAPVVRTHVLMFNRRKDSATALNKCICGLFTNTLYHA